MSAYPQTVEEAADLLEICAAGGSPGATRLLPLADALRSGLAPALDRARQEERERWHRMIEGQLAAERKSIETGEARNRELHHYSILVLEYIRDTWPLPTPPPPTPVADAGGRRCGTCAMACSTFKPAHWSCSSWRPRREGGEP